VVHGEKDQSIAGNYALKPNFVALGINLGLPGSEAAVTP